MFGADRPLAAAGLVVRRTGKTIFAHCTGDAAGLAPEEAQPRPFTPDTKMRIASVSKLAVTMTALSLHDEGLLDLDADVQRWWSGLRNPAYPDVPITMAQLLSHRSSLIDPEVYWLAVPGKIESLVTEEAFGQRGPPGEWFSYCNLNYGIAATILERAAKTRFDRLARERALEPIGIDGAGFNWSGVSRTDRRAGATLYRKVDGVWAVQTDGAEALADNDPVGLREEGFDLRDYVIGTNGTLFSPQGGLRASLNDMAVMARAVAGEARLNTVLWRYDADTPNGDVLGGLFKHVGLGSFIWEGDGPISGVRMVGHDGEAYGLYSGTWALPDLDAEIALAVTGTPEGDQPAGSTHPGYNRWSQALFDLAADILDVA